MSGIDLLDQGFCHRPASGVESLIIIDDMKANKPLSPESLMEKQVEKTSPFIVVGGTGSHSFSLSLFVSLIKELLGREINLSRPLYISLSLSVL